MELLSKKNLFIYCCVAASLSLITYITAFSCEISWILEARGDLPTPAYLLCAGYFILFVASTILIHGLVTGLSWGLFSWSVIIGVLSIPELGLVMFMTIQFWGLQSTHGLTELIGYLLRLIINCLALMSVIPTALRWRQERKTLSQLQSLATRLQLTTPSPNFTSSNDAGSIRNSKRSISRRSSGFDNPGFLTQDDSIDIIEYSNKFGSQNEFNASIFGLNASQYIGPPIISNEAKKTQSLLDLRCFFSPTHKIKSKDETDSVILNNNNKKNLNNSNANSNNNHNNNNSNKMNNNDVINDPIYYTINETNLNNNHNNNSNSNNNDKYSSKSQTILGRNCVSLENLGAITTAYKNDFNGYNSNLIQNYNLNPWNIVGYSPNNYYYQQQQLFYHHLAQQQQHPFPPYLFQQQQQYYNNNVPLFFTPNPNTINSNLINNGFYTNATNSNTNSRQSLGNQSDDYRKYRDVAL